MTFNINVNKTNWLSVCNQLGTLHGDNYKLHICTYSPGQSPLNTALKMIRITDHVWLYVACILKCFSSMGGALKPHVFSYLLLSSSSGRSVAWSRCCFVSPDIVRTSSPGGASPRGCPQICDLYTHKVFSSQNANRSAWLSHDASISRGGTAFCSLKCPFLRAVNQRKNLFSIKKCAPCWKNPKSNLSVYVSSRQKDIH